MWTVVYLSADESMVKKLRQLLESNNIMVRVHPVNGSGSGDGCYEVLVPQAEMDDAQNLIIDAEFN